MPKISLVALMLAGGLALGTPAIAQDAAADAKVPTCSATVTDHCIQREHHAMAATHHAMKGKHHKARRHHHRHAGKHHPK